MKSRKLWIGYNERRGIDELIMRGELEVKMKKRTKIKRRCSAIELRGWQNFKDELQDRELRRRAPMEMLLIMVI